MDGMGPGERLGDYVLERALGAGGMKRVWRAFDLRRRQHVAVAVLHRFAPDMFRNEVALAQRIDSPHVARVLDGFVTPEGLGVVVSELCDGVDHARWRQANPDVTVGDALAIAAQLGPRR